MNRRALLKGLGRAVAGLAALPLVSLLPKASPIVHAAGGIPIRDGLHQFTFYQGRLFALDYGLPHVIHVSRPVSRAQFGEIYRWGDKVGSLIEEEVRKSLELPFENNVLTLSDESEEITEEN